MTITGLHTVWELRGIKCFTLEKFPDMKKSILSSRSFGKSILSKGDIFEAVSTYTEQAAETLRKEKGVTGVLQVFIRTNYHRSSDPQYSNSYMVHLSPQTNITSQLIEAAHTALEKIFRPGFRYYKAGVMFTDISHEEDRQLHLYDSQLKSSRLSSVMKVIDTINQQEGAGTLQYASSGINKSWKIRSQFRSPNYTTEWSDLLKVSAYRY
jgi:DNA polymerase V